MNLTVIGTGYVGLVTGACFAEMGTTVTCIDIDEKKIVDLKKGIIPIYEPGLEEIVKRNYEDGRLKFTTSLSDPAARTGIYMISVGTPPGKDGSADLQFVLDVARNIGQEINEYSIIIDKSTVPVGTADKVREAVSEELQKRKLDVEFDVVSNPEFLKEGAAVDDFMKPDRIIIGTDSSRVREKLSELYHPFMRSHDRVIFMGIRDAEMTKYAANAMLATKISFMNEIATLCDRLDVDVENVRKGIGSDSRIGYGFIYPGAGYGGSCFPKDVKALVRTSRQSGIEPWLLEAVERRNEAQKAVLFNKIQNHFGADLTGKHFALWGLSFKPGTDDMREAPSKVLIEKLIEAGATVTAHDPVAMDAATKELPEKWFEDKSLVLAEQQYDAVKGADALILVTEWKPYRRPDLDKIKTLLKSAVIFDGRNQYNPEEMENNGLTYYGIGRGVR